MSPAASLKQIYFLIFLSIMIPVSKSMGQAYTRGVGVYPGDPKEDFSPSMRIDSSSYRNLALHRPAYQSSCYDYDLTAQLITDGIVETHPAGWIIVSTSTEGKMGRIGREWILDRNPLTGLGVDAPKGWMQIELAGGYRIPDVDSFRISGTVEIDSLPAKYWEMTVSESSDGKDWKTLRIVSGSRVPGDTVSGDLRFFYPPNTREIHFTVKPDTTVHDKFYRLDFNSPNAESWSIAEFAMYHDGKQLDIGGPYQFSSAWKSGGSGEEWVYVDLGSECAFDRVTLYWLQRAAGGSVQVSDDAKSWRDVAPLPINPGDTSDIRLNMMTKGRYVKVLMTKPVFEDGYMLSELQVFGTGGPVTVPHPRGISNSDGTMDLDGGAWKIQRSSLVEADGETLSKPGFDDTNWLVATVPATVLVSYLNDGALPDPDFGDNQLLISDSFFYSDFWYRDVFTVSDSLKGKRSFLNFNGINWKAEVYLNGKKLGRIEGAFTRTHFDVTDVLIVGENVLAVCILKNDNPGFVKEPTKLSHGINGGALGADDPTLQPSVGWDWIPTIRGRNIGIWNDVYLSTAGPVTIEDPFVSSNIPLPDTTSADLEIEVTLHNHVAESVRGTLQGKFGDIKFEEPVMLDGSEIKTIRLNPSTNPLLRLKNPKLWWPNGYGEQNLYNVQLKFVTSNGRESDVKTFKAGIRTMSYSEAGGALRIWVNGKRFVARGGNWGFPESMMRYRAREYDAAVRYHKEMNFTMIRDWVGQTADDDFYNACDKYGIMVWQDFWLANPFDGPNPNDDNMFVRNADDFVRLIRNHPSIGLYCGRNEGNPPAVIDSSLRRLLSQLDPGVHYIPNSAADVVSGGGTYRAMPVKFYFEKRATPKLHSEIGMPNMVSYESLKRMIPDSALWPINRLWGMHDFNLESAQYGDSFIKLVADDFGQMNDLKEWLQLAQWINYDGYRAIFEAQAKYRMGALLWMSHPAWPSMVWQTYDYYFEPTAAYFGCKKACEPLHIQWNAFTDSVEVVNYSVSNGSRLTATMEILDIHGKLMLEKRREVNCPEDHIVHCFILKAPKGISGVYFIRLRLTRGKELISENFYWHESKNGSLEAIRKLPKVKLKLDTRMSRGSGTWYIAARLTNSSKTPALMVKLKVVGDKRGGRILPVIFSDNYVSIMPGEQRTIRMELQDADTHGEKPVVVAGGINIE